MKNTINVSGQKIRRAVMASGYSKEQVVAHVQDKGFKLSLSGLDKMYRNEFPVKDLEVILIAVAEKCRCQVSDFAESEAMTA